MQVREPSNTKNKLEVEKSELRDAVKARGGLTHFLLRQEGSFEKN